MICANCGYFRVYIKKYQKISLICGNMLNAIIRNKHRAVRFGRLFCYPQPNGDTLTLDDIERIVRAGRHGKMRDAFLRAIYRAKHTGISHSPGSTDGISHSPGKHDRGTHNGIDH